jgi:hypothetical protein
MDIFELTTRATRASASSSSSRGGLTPPTLSRQTTAVSTVSLEKLQETLDAFFSENEDDILVDSEMGKRMERRDVLLFSDAQRQRLSQSIHAAMVPALRRAVSEQLSFVEDSDGLNSLVPLWTFSTVSTGNHSGKTVDVGAVYLVSLPLFFSCLLCALYYVLWFYR